MAKGTTKIDLKQPDRFQSLTLRIYNFILENRRQAYIASGAAALVIIIALGLYFYHLRYESKAAGQYAEAYASYRSVDTAEEEGRDALMMAAAKYEQLVENYSRSKPARLALYNLGNIYYSLGEYEQAVEAYTTYLQKGSKRNMLKPLAAYGLGYSYEALGEFDKAIEAFLQAVDDASGLHFKIINYANLGRIYEKMNDVEQAVQYFEKVYEADTDPLLAALAARRIANLK